MSIVKGLKDLNKALDKPSYSGGDENKGRWLKVEDGESVKIRFLQELDPDSPTYNDKLGCGFIALEHTNPKDYRRKALDTMESEGRDWANEQHRKDPKAGWKARTRLYINVLVDDGKEEPYVAVLNTHVNKDNVRNGFFELDWNDHFVLKLKQEGYGYDGDKDEEIVDRWFRELCANVVVDENLPEVNTGVIDIQSVKRNNR